jgi:hypothetical protein
MTEAKKLVSSLHWERERERHQMSVQINGYQDKDAKIFDGKMHHAQLYICYLRTESARTCKQME